MGYSESSDLNFPNWIHTGFFNQLGEQKEFATPVRSLIVRAIRRIFAGGEIFV